MEDPKDIAGNASSNRRRGFIKAAAGATAGIVAAIGVGATPAQAAVQEPTSQENRPPLPFAQADIELGRKILENPEAVLELFGLNSDDVVAPSEIDAAISARASFCLEVKTAVGNGMTDPTELTRFCRSLAMKHFGDNHRLDIQPFGLLFKETLRFEDMKGRGGGDGGTIVTVTILCTNAYGRLVFDPGIDPSD